MAGFLGLCPRLIEEVGDLNLSAIHPVANSKQG